jgi:predicted tellurium resistance membrane protein TerC
VAEGFGQHIDKAYIYFAMAFAVLVEAINIRATRRSRPLQLRDPYREKESADGTAGPPRSSDDDAEAGAAPA